MKDSIIANERQDRNNRDLPPELMTTTSYDELKWSVDEPPLDATACDVGCQTTTTTTVEEMMTASSSPTTTTYSEVKSQNKSSSSSSFLPLHAERTALLVVDVQPEYWSQCPAVRRDFPDFPDNLRRTVDTCRRRGCAKVIWVRADYRYSHSPWLKQFARIHGLQDEVGGGPRPTDDGKDDKNPTTTPVEFRIEVPCDPRDTDRFTWEEFAMPAGGEVIIPKQSWSSTSNTALTDVLRASSVDTVLVCGLITSVCVQHSAFGIFEAGYRTVMVTDACADRGRARHEAALALYGDYMYELLTSEELESETSTRRLGPARPIFILPTKHREEGVVGSGEECEERCRVYESPVLSPSPVPAMESESSLSSTTSSSSSSVSSFTEFAI